jgi:hypothetical protein
MHVCKKCSHHGLYFRRQFKPEESMVGKPYSPIWIIGLNPQGDEGHNDESQTVESLYSYFSDGNVHSYFNDFEKISFRLFALLGHDQGVAHTDLVKCDSMRFPPKTVKRGGPKFIIEQCKGYLQTQIRTYHPKILVCNGAPVSHTLRKMYPPEKDDPQLTSYTVTDNEHQFSIVLSGFVGRIDNFAKYRLGKEIEMYMDLYGL